MTPGIILALSEGIARRSADRKRRPGRIAELARSAAPKGAAPREEVVIEGDWTGAPTGG